MISWEIVTVRAIPKIIHAHNAESRIIFWFIKDL